MSTPFYDPTDVPLIKNPRNLGDNDGPEYPDNEFDNDYRDEDTFDNDFTDEFPDDDLEDYWDSYDLGDDEDEDLLSMFPNEEDREWDR